MKNSQRVPTSNASGTKRFATTWSRKLGRLAFGCVVGLLIAEVSLRVIGTSYPSFYVVDEIVGYVPRPGAAGWYRSEGKGYVRINSHGMRDREHSKTKPIDTYRIAILGDSYSEAKEVNMEEAYWSVMERNLNGCEALQGKEIEVLNFGVSGYGTAQELLTLRHRALAFAPDLVVLQVCMNDIKDNSRDLKGDPMRPYFVCRDGELAVDESFRQSDKYLSRKKPYARLLYRTVNCSRVLQVLMEARKGLARLRDKSQLTQDTNGQASPDVGEVIAELFREPQNSLISEAWKITEELIVMIRDEAVSRGADFVVVRTSSPHQVHPSASVRESLMASLGVENLSYVDSRIKVLGDLNGFEVLTMAAAFLAYAEEHQVFLHGFANTELGTGHWNADGHRLAGEMIAQRICDRLRDNKTTTAN